MGMFRNCLSTRFITYAGSLTTRQDLEEGLGMLSLKTPNFQ